jgi:secreted protein with Ig-like and vWFA domain
MNHDDNTNTTNTLTPELEARVVAWVAGETSAFETAELERLTTDKPELAIFKRRMQAVHGLVAEAVRPDKDPLRLSPERRGKLLQALGAKGMESSVPKKGSTESPVVSLKAYGRVRPYYRRGMFVLAACVTVGLFVAISIPSFQKIGRKQSMVSFLAGEADYSDQAVPASQPMAAMKQESEAKYKLENVKQKKAYEGAVRLAEKSRQTSSGDRKEFEAKRRDERLDTLAKIGNETSGRVAQRQKTATPANRPEPAAPAQGSALLQRGFSDGIPADARTSALVGGRLNTSLSDVASNITVITKQDEYGKQRGAGGAKGNLAPPSAPAPSVIAGLGLQSAIDGPKSEADKSVVAKDEETVVLSPFEITSPKESGRVAKNSPSDFNLIQAPGLKDVIKLDEDRSENAEKKAVQAEEKVADVPAVTEVIAAKEPVSTFSLHVSDVSFKIAKDALANGTDIDRERIRPEEFYNAFNYGDPSPVMAEKITCRIEQAAHPLLQQRNLVRISMKVAAAGRGAGQPLRLTVLLDTSGSMERDDRAAAVRRAMQSLVSLLGPNDRITLIGFARQPRLLAESVPGDQAGELLDIIANTPAEGGTNLEEALKLGRELAQRHFEETAQNRIVLLTDGAANLGNANRDELAASIVESRQEGIAFDACGVGMEGLDDAMLETLSRKGDGRYYVLNSAEDADAGFARQLAGALRPAAKNVKVQVRFNSARVKSYRLIGFEQHRLREEDFRNDKVDAAELAAEEAAVAVYQVEPLPQGEGELGEVFVRFLDPSTGGMVERSWTLPYEPKAPTFDRASPTLQLAGTAALLAETLQRGKKEDAVQFNELTPVVNALRGHFPNNERVDDLIRMAEQLKKRSAE